MDQKDIIQFIMLGVIIMERAFEKIFKLFKPFMGGKSNGRSNNGNGTAKLKERITANETKIGNNESNIDLLRKENREDHRHIFEKLEDISVAVAERK